MCTPREPSTSVSSNILQGLGFTHRLHNSSSLGLPYRILNTNHKKELLWSLWVGFKGPTSQSKRRIGALKGLRWLREAPNQAL